ncbi:MAG TPA: 4Fe-4S binding protein [bacterium]|nr:4Fe-4S binding protein [bacterium]
MPHTILSTCIGCTLCEVKCPTEAIAGEKKSMFNIDPALCIDCGVCGIHCPVEAIVNSEGEVVKKIKPLAIPKAKVDPETCTACEFCVDICPFDCISMQPRTDSPEFFKIAVVDEKKCVSCKLCETVCIKGSITIDRPAELMSFAPNRSH